MQLPPSLLQTGSGTLAISAAHTTQPMHQCWSDELTPRLPASTAMGIAEPTPACSFLQQFRARVPQPCSSWLLQQW